MPLFYFLIDISCVNAYLLWKWSSTANSENAQWTYNSHRDFMNALYTELLYSNDKIEKKQQQKDELHLLPTIALQCHHYHVQKKSFGRYKWGKLHSPGCLCKRSFKKHKFEMNITALTVNGISETISGGSCIHYECSKCQIWLCIEGECWAQYHHSIGVNC